MTLLRWYLERHAREVELLVVGVGALATAIVLMAICARTVEIVMAESTKAAGVVRADGPWNLTRTATTGEDTLWHSPESVKH